MLRKNDIAHALLLALIALLPACSPEVNVYAPERELYIVYGVLDPHKAVQYVTVTKVYQFEGDAYAFAAENDLTARGLQVSLRVDSTVQTATLVDLTDSVPNLFAKTTGAYRFETVGANAIKPGHRYDLAIKKPDDPNFLITAYTEVPTQPQLTSPGPPIYSLQQGTFSFPTVEFSEDQAVYIDRGTGKGFELRVFVDYLANDGHHVARWGPTPVFKTPVRCPANTGRGEICYKISGGAVPNTLNNLFGRYADTVYVYDTLRVAKSLDSLNKTSWIEVTAVDSFLTSYLISSNPFGFGLNLLMDKKDYSNISGDHAGIFGSINTSSHYIFLGSCTRWLAGLRGRRPSGCGG